MLRLSTWQNSILESDSRRILVSAGRRTGKSTLARNLALRHCQRHPGSIVILVIIPSFADERFSLQHYALKNEAIYFDNGSEIRVITDSVNPKDITADLIVLDDAAYMADEFLESLPDADLVAISTPKRDNKGWFYRSYMSGDFECYRISCYDVDHIDQEELDAVKDHLSEWAFRNEMLAEFVGT